MRERLVSGQFLKPRGLSGEIGLRPFVEDLRHFLDLRDVFAEDEAGNVRFRLSIVHVSLAGDRVFLRFAGRPNRESVEALVGLYLAVDRKDAQPLAEGSWYDADLIGCTVLDRKRGELGQVRAIQSNGAQNLLVISQAGEADLLAPFMKAYRLEVDIQRSRILLDLPEGLYEVYRHPAEKD